jgi:hypothetical protein
VTYDRKIVKTRGKTTGSSNFVSIAGVKINIPGRKAQGKTRWIKRVLLFLDQLINNTFHYNSSCINDTSSVEKHI